MSSPTGFTFGAPPGRLDLLFEAEMMHIGVFPASDGGQRGALQPNRHLSYRHAFRKRRSSPVSGPARKRRADEELVIGDLRNLSLSNIQARQQKSQLRRWQELEAQLADELAKEEEQHQPRVVLSDELREIISSPAPDLIPDTRPGSACTALVLWQPPLVLLPKSAEDPLAQRPSAAPRPPSVPPPPATAYDFSAFGRPTQPSPAFLFGGGGSRTPSPGYWWAPDAQFGSALSAAPAPSAVHLGSAPSPLIARSLDTLPSADESMEL